MSCAPPSVANLLNSSIAFRNASVFDVFPSPLPPKSVNNAVCFQQLKASYSIHSAVLRQSIPHVKTTINFLRNCSKK
uniref:Glycoside hydrolase, family 28 n=1 Tax=Solanum tuberosum TaxID=4113 RepID=M1AKE1_SOLTU